MVFYANSKTILAPLGATPVVRDEQVTLVVDETNPSITGDDFTVVTDSGIQICEVKGKVLNFSNKKVFKGTNGKELFSMKAKRFSVYKNFQGLNPKGDKLFRVKRHLLYPLRSTCTFRSAANHTDVELDITEAWFHRSAAITNCGQPVADIKRISSRLKGFAKKQREYSVTVAPQVDLTLISALCVYLDEKNENKRRKAFKSCLS